MPEVMLHRSPSVRVMPGKVSLSRERLDREAARLRRLRIRLVGYAKLDSLFSTLRRWERLGYLSREVGAIVRKDLRAHICLQDRSAASEERA